MENIDLSNIIMFKNKKIKLHQNIYLNDEYPNCFLIECEEKLYKVRKLSKFNKNAITCEINAINILSPYLGNMIPKIIESNSIDNDNSSYIVESFLPGKSLDKLTDKELIFNSHIIMMLGSKVPYSTLKSSYIL